MPEVGGGGLIELPHARGRGSGLTELPHARGRGWWPN